MNPEVYMHVEFLNLFTVSVALNFVYVIRETPRDDVENSNGTHSAIGFCYFLQLLGRNKIKPIEREFDENINYVKSCKIKLELLKQPFEVSSVKKSVQKDESTLEQDVRSKEKVVGPAFAAEEKKRAQDVSGADEKSTRPDVALNETGKRQSLSAGPEDTNIRDSIVKKPQDNLDIIASKIKKLQPCIDGLVALKNRQLEIHGKTSRLTYISSACLLVGLYVLLVLFYAPLVKGGFVTDACANAYFFCADCVCFLFLLSCVLWDYSESAQLDRATNVWMVQKIQCLPKPNRRLAITLFVVLFVGALGFCLFGRFVEEKLKAVSFLNHTYILTSFICYSTFIIYFFYYCSRSAYTRLRGKIMQNYYMDKLNEEDFDGMVQTMKDEANLMKHIGVEAGDFGS